MANASTSNRRETIRQFFRYADAGDTGVLDLYTDDIRLTSPKFGMAVGKEAVRTFTQRMAKVLRKLVHDIDGLSFIESGDTIAVEGREWGETTDGTPFPDGDISHGLFCNVFEFRGALICAVRIYVDPDFTNRDTALIAALR